MPVHALPVIVLVRPRNPNNIGAAARAMANFGFTDLRVVSPHPPIWREARSAVGAETLLKRAKVCENLSAALADRTTVWATSSLKGRKSSLSVLPLKGLKPLPKTAVVFGPEKTGLTTADMGYCHALLRIPTVSACPSMNLAAAVAVVCCELAANPVGKPLGTVSQRISGAEMERLLEAAERVFSRIGYRPAMTPQTRQRRLREILNRRGLDKQEAGLIFEVARRILES